MKVRISFTVDIDRETWELTYGANPEGLRKDVQEHARHMVTEFYRDQLLLEWKRTGNGNS